MTEDGDESPCPLQGQARLQCPEVGGASWACAGLAGHSLPVQTPSPCVPKCLAAVGDCRCRLNRPEGAWDSAFLISPGEGVVCGTGQTLNSEGRRHSVVLGVASTLTACS